MLRLSVVCLSSSVQNVLWPKRCVLGQKLLLTAYRKSYKKSIGTKMNDREHCLEVVSRSCQPPRYIRRWISRKPLEIEAWFQRTTIGNGIWVSKLRDRWRHVTPKRCCEAVRSTILAIAWLLVRRGKAYIWDWGPPLRSFVTIRGRAMLLICRLLLISSISFLLLGDN